MLGRSLVTGFDDADDALLQYLIDTGRVEDSSGNILEVKDVLDQVVESYNKLDEESKTICRFTRATSYGFIKSGR